MIEKVQAEINRIVHMLARDQAADGDWQYCAESGVLTDAYMIILLRTLQIDDERIILSLVERIWSKQAENGAWKLFEEIRRLYYSASDD